MKLRDVLTDQEIVLIHSGKKQVIINFLIPFFFLDNVLLMHSGVHGENGDFVVQTVRRRDSHFQYNPDQEFVSYLNVSALSPGL